MKPVFADTCYYVALLSQTDAAKQGVMLNHEC